MNDRNLMMLSAMVGGAVGACVGFVLFTERGRQLRSELQPELETLVTEVVRLGQMVDDLRNHRPIATARTAGPRPVTGSRRTT